MDLLRNDESSSRRTVAEGDKVKSSARDVADVASGGLELGFELGFDKPIDDGTAVSVWLKVDKLVTEDNETRAVRHVDARSEKRVPGNVVRNDLSDARESSVRLVIVNEHETRDSVCRCGARELRSATELNVLHQDLRANPVV